MKIVHEKLICLFICIAMSPLAMSQISHTINFSSQKEMQDYFSYTGDHSILISGHRGSRDIGYPENSIASFNHVLEKLPAFFEIDPRLTKDSVIVLMHDATLDRTTTGKGKVSDYTWEELQKLYLLDSEGNETKYKIPTLEEAIKWSKGKTVLNLDKKDVPLDSTIEIIKNMKAENHVMVTVHTGAQAKYYYDRIPSIMMSAFIRNEKEFEDMELSGVPWESIIAYVGHNINKNNKELIKKLNKLGVRCMISFAPNHDKLPTVDQREEGYIKEILTKPDIIESDYPIEVWKALYKVMKCR